MARARNSHQDVATLLSVYRKMTTIGGKYRLLRYARMRGITALTAIDEDDLRGVAEALRDTSTVKRRVVLRVILPFLDPSIHLADCRDEIFRILETRSRINAGLSTIGSESKVVVEGPALS
jgi:hypothetical protein